MEGVWKERGRLWRVPEGGLAQEVYFSSASRVVISLSFSERLCITECKLSRDILILREGAWWSVSPPFAVTLVLARMGFV